MSPVNRRFAQLTEGLSSTYWFLWAGMLLNRAGSFVVPMMTVYLTTQRHLSLVEAGTIVALFGLGSMVGTTLGGVLADRLGRRATLLLALTGGAVMMLTLARAQSVLELSASVFLLGSALDMFRPAAFSIVADVVQSEHRLKAFSALYWAANLGFAFATSIGGLAAARHFDLLFTLDAGSMLAFAAIVAVRVPETRPARTKETSGSVAAPGIPIVAEECRIASTPRIWPRCAINVAPSTSPKRGPWAAAIMAPVDRSSSKTGAAPPSRSTRIVWLPMNPARPVTSTVIRHSFAREDGRPGTPYALRKNARRQPLCAPIRSPRRQLFREDSGVPAELGPEVGERRKAEPRHDRSSPPNGAGPAAQGRP